MATRLLLDELSQAHDASQAGPRLGFESIGGVDAAKRVAAGEAFDLVVLGADAMAKLLAAGHLRAGSLRPLVISPVAVAVPAGAARPDISTEAALRAAVSAAASIGYSTGPSGTALLALFERWGLSAEIGPRLVQAPPGVPVGRLVAEGRVALGFQQLPELLHVVGIALLGTLPDEAAILTTFSGAVASTSTQPEAAQAALDWLASPATLAAKQRQGMQPA